MAARVLQELKGVEKPKVAVWGVAYKADVDDMRESPTFVLMDSLKARGAALLAAVNAGLPTSEYAPREVKQAVVGNGNASKEQVQYMVRALLSLAEPPRPFDVSDAMAVALCHLHRRSAGKPRAASWKAFESLRVRHFFNPIKLDGYGVLSIEGTGRFRCFLVKRENNRNRRRLRK